MLSQLIDYVAQQKEDYSNFGWSFFCALPKLKSVRDKGPDLSVVQHVLWACDFEQKKVVVLFGVIGIYLYICLVKLNECRTQLNV